MSGRSTGSRQMVLPLIVLVIVLGLMPPFSPGASWESASAEEIATATATAVESGDTGEAATPTPTVGDDPASQVGADPETATPTETEDQATLEATATSTADEATATSTPTGTATPTSSVTTMSTPTPGLTVTPTVTATATVTPTATVVTGVATNDDFGSATVIGAFPYALSEDTSDATSAADDPDMGNGKHGHTVWFRFTAPEDGRVFVSTLGSDYDTVVAVFTGSRGSLSRIAANDDAWFSRHSQLEFDVAEGTTYYLEIASRDPAAGRLWLAAEFSPALLVTGTPTATFVPGAGPDNDDFDQAWDLESLPFSGSQDTSDATLAHDDPDMGAGDGSNSATVWFRFTAPSSGAIRIDTFGSSYDTVLAVYRGSRGNLTLVDSNDDFVGDLRSEVVFNAQAGVTYYVEVAEWGEDGDGGYLSLSVEYGTATVVTATPVPTPYPTIQTLVVATPPANDNIDGATVIATFPFTGLLNVTGATSESGDPDMGAGLGANSNTVWYRFVAPATGSVRISTSGSGYDTVVALFTGAPGSLTLVDSNDDADANTTRSLVHTNVQAETHYYVEVAQYGQISVGGYLRLSVQFSPELVTPTPIGTVMPGGITGPLGSGPAAKAGAPSVIVIPAPLRPDGPVARDERYFPETGYRINLFRFWDYFQRRGGVRTFGYPISWEFPFMGSKVQFFQRSVMQLMPDGSIATMNLLDDGLLPYNRINSSIFPLAEEELIDSAPSSLEAGYAERAIEFVRANVPDRWEGLEVNFLQTFMSTITYEDAYPEGDGDRSLVPLLNLELWGLPTSKPTRDPNNADFVYQRFQRGIMHFDRATGLTQGLLLADHLKSVMTGVDLPKDLEGQAKGSPLLRQYDPAMPGFMARPLELPNTNLDGAFEPMLINPVASPAPVPEVSPTRAGPPVPAAAPSATRVLR